MDWIWKDVVGLKELRRIKKKINHKRCPGGNFNPEALQTPTSMC
jgi:hypothetical protein